MAEPTYYHSEDLLGLVHAKYPGPTYIVLSEVRDSTGFSRCGREADAMAFGMWPSCGLNIVGFEFKSSRSDWLRELKNPAKAEGIACHCDEWWLVCGEGVANLDEIPSAWGWYLASGTKLKSMKQPVGPAGPGGAMALPTNVDRHILMSIVRNITKGYVPMHDVEARVESGVAEEIKRRLDGNDYRLKRLEKIEKLLSKFKAESGVDLEADWNFPVKEVGVIVRACMKDNILEHIAHVERAAKAAKEVLEAIQALPLKDDKPRHLGQDELEA